MIEYIPIILICNSLSPREECNEGNKDITSMIGETQRTPNACLIEGNTKAAQLAFSPKIGDTFYVKIKCVPREITEIGR